MSLFDLDQMMRKTNKAALGKYIKDKSILPFNTQNSLSPLIIDGGWLLHQLSLFKGCDNFEDVAD